MSSQGRNDQHLGRTQYENLRDTLLDAQRVLEDLTDQAAGQLVVPVDELEFLLRRARKLVAACVRTAFEEGL